MMIYNDIIYNITYYNQLYRWGNLGLAISPELIYWLTSMAKI